MTYEDDDFIVKPSPIEGLGLFTKRAFKKDEVVLHWHPKILTREEVEQLPESERRYLNTMSDDGPLLMQVPERYVNSSDNPNTRFIGRMDVAIRDIEPGEEITSHYPVG